MVARNFVSTITGLPYYLAEPVYLQLKRAKERVRKGKSDRVIIIDGREGTGKSTLAMQLAYVVDPTFNINRVCFKWDEFFEKGRKLKPHRAIIFDEAHNGLSAKSALSKQNKKLVQFLMEVRQRNLFIFIVLPSIFMLERYVAIFRSQALFHTFVGAKNYENRYFKIYSYNKKKILYIFGKQYLDYSKPRIPKSYRFYGKLPPTINPEEYLALKLKAFKDSSSDNEILGRKEGNWKLKCLHCWDYLLNKYDETLKSIAEMHYSKGDKVAVSYISECLTKERENGSKKFGF